MNKRQEINVCELKKFVLYSSGQGEIKFQGQQYRMLTKLCMFNIKENLEEFHV